MANDLQDIAGLWESRSGKGYNGTMKAEDKEAVKALLEQPGDVRILMFPVTSDNPKAPKFRVVMAPPEVKEDAGESW